MNIISTIEVLCSALWYSETAGPLAFDLLHQDHLLYDEYTVGEVLRDGDHVNTVSRPDIPIPSTWSVV